MLTLQLFKKFFPEFTDAGDAMIQAFIDSAEVADAELGTQAEYVKALVVAMRMADTPWGRNARLTDKDGKGSTYERRLREIGRSKSGGARVI